MKTRKKQGFTLIELMVVAIIVAILAAVLLPLIVGNKARAVATEGQAGISAVRTAIRVYEAENGALPADTADVTTLPGLQAGDLDGTYFDDGSYVYDNTGAGYTVTATVRAGAPDFVGDTVILTVAADGSTTWTGTLLD